MLLSHRGQEPSVDPSAYIAPSAVIVGDVHISAGARILHGAVLTAEDGRVRIGENTVVMEHALIRGRDGQPALVGSSVMVGPNAHVNGSMIESGVFIATGAALFPGSRIGVGAEIRIHGVVHVNTTLGPGQIVPIGWIAVGTPARIFPPDRHDDIWAVQRKLNFVGTVYGVDPGTPMDEIMLRQSEFYGAHRDDQILED